jgi:NADPH2:quinone reductase
LGFEAAAGLVLAASTAMHMLTDRATVHRGDWVLVMGAASGVGSAAIQIARHFGARVIATASTPAKRELAQRLGAEHVLDPAQAAWPAQVRHLTGKSTWWWSTWAAGSSSSCSTAWDAAGRLSRVAPRRDGR